jgi:hypothetical protein
MNVDPFFPAQGRALHGWLAQPADGARVTFHRSLAGAMRSARGDKLWHEAEAQGARVLPVTVYGGHVEIAAITEPGQ